MISNRETVATVQTDGTVSVVYPSGKSESFPSAQEYRAAVVSGSAFPYRLGAIRWEQESVQETVETTTIAQQLVEQGCTVEHALSVAHAITSGDTSSLSDTERATFEDVYAELTREDTATRLPSLQLEEQDERQEELQELATNPGTPELEPMTEESTMDTMTIHTVSPSTFRVYYGAALLQLPPLQRDALTPVEELELTTDGAYYVTSDGLSGYAIVGQELRYLFSLARGRGDELVRDAIGNGARELDCFDGYLPTLYGRHGFVETMREGNWTPGGPDVVWMRWQDPHAGTIVTRGATAWDDTYTPVRFLPVDVI